jgi:hypothetical protein
MIRAETASMAFAAFAWFLFSGATAFAISYLGFSLLRYFAHYLIGVLLAGAAFGYFSDYFFIKRGQFFLIQGYERAFRAMGAALLIFSFISLGLLAIAATAFQK